MGITQKIFWSLLWFLLTLFGGWLAFKYDFKRNQNVARL